MFAVGIPYPPVASQEIFAPFAGDPDMPQATGAWGVDFFWPLGFALVFTTLAALMRYGSRLERDTAGLV